MKNLNHKINFLNAAQQKLAGILTLPLQKTPLAWAIFAHCFTCGKDLASTSYLIEKLTHHGLAVLRFDFRGLGSSAGSFAESNFTTNLEDLKAAAQFLEQHYLAPQLLIGHSLGGTAVLHAAEDIQSVNAVVTIGAPAEPSHIKQLFKDSLSAIQTAGTAKVRVGPKKIVVQKQFLTDLDENKLQRSLQQFSKPLMVMHSATDDIVDVHNANIIFKMAQHPKSFISLGTADHLLSQTKDALLVGNLIGTWVQQYLVIPKPSHAITAKAEHMRFYTQIQAGEHSMVADEPLQLGGTNLGSTPYGYLASALASCKVITVQMYARRKSWLLDSVKVKVSYHQEHLDDCEQADKPGKTIVHFNCKLNIESDLDTIELERLLEISKRCPVHKVLEQSSVVHTELTSE